MTEVTEEEILKKEEEILLLKEKIHSKEEELKKKGKYEDFLEWEIQEHFKAFCQGKSCIVCSSNKEIKGTSLEDSLQILCLCPDCMEALDKGLLKERAYLFDKEVYIVYLAHGGTKLEFRKKEERDL